MRRDDVGVGDARQVDILFAMHVGEGANAIADERGGIEIEGLGSCLHVFGEGRLDVLPASATEVTRLGDEASIVFPIESSNAGRAATLDLIEKARPRAAGEHAVAARAQ